MSVKRKDGKFFAPLGSLYRVAGGGMHFYARGTTALLLPAGAYEIIAWRGPEHRVFRSEVELEGGQRRILDVNLERWTDAWSRGWFSGENHIHANYGYGAWYNTPANLLDMCEGEDLNVCNLMVANSDGDGVFDREFFRGRLDARSTPRTLLYWNQEFRSTIWGHMTLSRPMPTSLIAHARKAASPAIPTPRTTPMTPTAPLIPPRACRWTWRWGALTRST